MLSRICVPTLKGKQGGACFEHGGKTIFCPVDPIHLLTEICVIPYIKGHFGILEVWLVLQLLGLTVQGGHDIPRWAYPGHFRVIVLFNHLFQFPQRLLNVVFGSFKDFGMGCRHPRPWDASSVILPSGLFWPDIVDHLAELWTVSPPPLVSGSHGYSLILLSS